jgi:hypothetical protein
VPPLDIEPEAPDWTTGAQLVPAGAEPEQSWNWTVPVSPPAVASSKDAWSCGTAFVNVVSAGLTSVGVAGATLSIDQLYDTEDVSTFPAWSVARTEKVCEPSGSALYVFGVVQPAYAPPSRLHSKVEPDSFETRSKVALVEGVCAAGVVAPIVVTGGVVSIVQVYEAGLGSVFAAESVALTWKVCGPSARAA